MRLSHQNQTILILPTGDGFFLKMIFFNGILRKIASSAEMNAIELVFAFNLLCIQYLIKKMKLSSSLPSFLSLHTYFE